MGSGLHMDVLRVLPVELSGVNSVVLAVAVSREFSSAGMWMRSICRHFPEIPSESNAAGRAIRPAVVARKMSRGSRSGRGPKTCSVLPTLFETWTLQGHNAITACREMIAASNGKSLPRN